jgi:Tfp pilus assembly protein PilN
MRPVNLIPPEERRDRAAIRTGPIAYLLVGALALALGGVTMLVLANNKISDKKAEVAQLTAQESAVKAQAQQYAAFTSFAQMENSRAATVKSLADSRFDWPRVMRELARVMPSDVWLTNLTGTVSSQVTPPSSSSGGSSSSGSTIDTTSITGPSLVLTGCAAGQDAVARFLGALRDIDGVTRVGLGSSDLPDQSTTGGTTSDSGASSGDCQTRGFIAKFSIVAAFDAVPAPQVPGASPAPTTPTSTAPTTPTSTTPAPTTPTTPAPTTPAPSTTSPSPATPASDTSATSAGD